MNTSHRENSKSPQQIQRGNRWETYTKHFQTWMQLRHSQNLLPLSTRRNAVTYTQQLQPFGFSICQLSSTSFPIQSSHSSYPQKTLFTFCFTIQLYTEFSLYHWFPKCAPWSQEIRDQFSEDPWVGFCSAYFKVLTFCWEQSRNFFNWRQFYFVWPLEYLINKPPVLTKRATSSN